MNVEFPRRMRVDQFTPAELAIYNATVATDTLPCDVRLTAAVTLLGMARDLVADFVDNEPCAAQSAGEVIGKLFDCRFGLVKHG
jgi:hypothetical protein